MPPRSGRIRLPNSSSHRRDPQQLRSLIRKALKARAWSDVKKVLLKRFRLNGLPLRVRPAFILLTSLSLFILSLLGFHPTLASRISPPIPFSDKLLHFVCFFFAAALFYGIWSVEEGERRWWWRWWPELCSGVVVLGFGSIGSEFVQALLPYKNFQIGDVVANLLGSSLGLLLSRHLSIQSRRQTELHRLYQPLNLSSLSLSLTASDASDDDNDDDDELDELEGGLGGASSREMAEGAERVEEAVRGGGGKKGKGKRKVAKVVNGGRRMKGEDPWDDDEREIFGLGDEDDEDEEEVIPQRSGGEDGSTRRT